MVPHVMFVTLGPGFFSRGRVSTVLLLVQSVIRANEHKTGTDAAAARILTNSLSSSDASAPDGREQASHFKYLRRSDLICLQHHCNPALRHSVRFLNCQVARHKTLVHHVRA
ncbi:hypothetical protein F5144DRAFT_252484 [Chaetomium tenue]|uniref:Uncharacterized protein n=1 Tax=Chaetomium tenue TaxID=1854479 RepID=A0ACB7P959_9PEZI|nr:hypothetical protein F5144DRAFT_252484 [Chaetomium globosum]